MKQILLFTTGMLAFILGMTQIQAKTSPLMTQQDKLSYSMGVETGKAFKKHDVKVSLTSFSQGLRDGMTGGKTRLTEAQIKQILLTFQKNSIAKLQSRMKEGSMENKQTGATFLAANKQKEGVMTTLSGLQYKIITKGTGAHPTQNDTVSVDYEGKLLDGKVFDSSYKRGKPATFPVGGVIQGWQEALKLMRTGATWELFIPSDLAYGARGASGTIGPNETLIFKVHLISINK